MRNRNGTADAGSVATRPKPKVGDRRDDRADGEQPRSRDDVRRTDGGQPDRPDGEPELDDDRQERQIQQTDRPFLAQDRRHRGSGERRRHREHHPDTEDRQLGPSLGRLARPVLGGSDGHPGSVGIIV